MNIKKLRNLIKTHTFIFHLKEQFKFQNLILGPF